MQERSSQKLLRFLLSLADGTRPATHLYLVGDVFDVWVGDHAYFEKRFGPLIEAILRCRDRGIRVQYFEGNHDVHVKRYWERRHQIACFTEAQYQQVGLRVLRIEHGDLINAQDEAYLKYREFIRRPALKLIAHVVPGLIFQRLGEKASRKSRTHSEVQRSQNETELRQMIRDHAVRSFGEKPFDLIVTGHMHILDDWNFEEQGRRVRSVNLGSWFGDTQVFHLTDETGTWVPVD